MAALPSSDPLHRRASAGARNTLADMMRVGTQTLGMTTGEAETWLIEQLTFVGGYLRREEEGGADG